MVFRLFMLTTDFNKTKFFIFPSYFVSFLFSMLTFFPSQMIAYCASNNFQGICNRRQFKSNLRQTKLRITLRNE